MDSLFLGLLVKFLEMIGLDWLARHGTNAKAQEIADAPLSNKEEADDLRH
jgi:hypothetical protein